MYPWKRRLFFSQIALAIGVLTSRLGGEGSQILWIRCRGCCHLMRGQEVSSDACMGGGSQYYFYIPSGKQT